MLFPASFPHVALVLLVLLQAVPDLVEDVDAAESNLLSPIFTLVMEALVQVRVR